MKAARSTAPLKGEDPMKVLKALVAQDPKRSLGFFQKSSDGSGVFQAEETTIGFDPLQTDAFHENEDPFLSLGKNSNKMTMGYLSYDCVRFREPILNRAQGGFSAIKPDFTSAEFSVFNHFIIFDHRAKKLTFLSQDGKSFPGFEQLLKTAASFPDKIPPPQSNAELKPEDLRCSLGSQAFKSGVRRLQEHIMAGDIFQAVLSERFEIPLSSTPLEIFETLIEIGSSAYQFYYSTPERTVLGASPELLLSVKNGKLETHPIAGTRPRGKTAEEELKNQMDLVQDTKENAEHLMLVDLARNDLGRISKPGSVKVNERNVVKKFPSVMHIVSKVVGDLESGKNAFDALASCFPAGTLSGAPKIRAMQLISEIEGTPRGFYGGAFFLSEGSQLEACISIRSMEIVGSRGFIQAGAGIVMDSNPDSEYEEVLHKSRTLRRAVAITEQRKGDR